MKKIFALVLAVAMLSSTAIAADVTIDTASVPGGNSAALNPAGTVGITPNALFGKDKAVLDVAIGDFSNANFAIATRKFSKGLNLVDTVTISDDDEQVVITMKQNLDLVAPKNSNVVIEDIIVKAKKTIDAKTAGTEIKKGAAYNFSHAVSSFRVGYTVEGVTFDATAIGYSNGTITEFKKATDGTSYAVASIQEGDIALEGRVYAGDKVYVKISSDVEKEVLKTYPDADLRFAKLDVAGMTSNHTIQVAAEETEFVYEIVEKKVVKSNLKWNPDVYAFEGKTATNKYYVISDIELKVSDAPAADAGTDTTNPETGANDVVGIAAALAVVSLVAAGAVSLKK